MEDKTQNKTYLNTFEQVGDAMSVMSEIKQATTVYLLSGKDIFKTSRAVGVSRSTIYAWLIDPIFQQALSEKKAHRRNFRSKFGEILSKRLLNFGVFRAVDHIVNFVRVLFADSCLDPGVAKQVRQGLPQRVGQHAHEHMRLDAIGFLMPHRAQEQIGFHRPKRVLGPRQLNIRAPKILR